MRVVGIFLNPEIRTGGHKRYLTFFQSLADKGHDIFLILNIKLDYSFVGITEIRINYTYHKKIIPYSVISLIKVRQNIKKISKQVKLCDYVIIFGETHLLAGSYLKKMFNSKLLFALRSNGVEEARIKRREAGISLIDKSKLLFSEYKYRHYEKLFGRESDILVFQSNFDKDSFLVRNPKLKHKVSVIPGNIGGSWFDPGYKDSNNSRRLQNIIFLGAVSVRKGIKYLVYAVHSLIKDGNDINLKIAGSGGLENELRQYISKNGIADRVRFLGKIDDNLEQISKADLLVVPSIFDSYPNVILESLHVGTPVIAARSGGIPDMLEDSDLFEPSNVDEIYKILSRLYNDNSSYLNMKKRLIENRGKFYFDWAQSFLELMKDD